MIFHDRMFVGETAGKHKIQLLWNLKRGKKQKDLYVITLADGAGRLLEVYHGEALQLKLFRTEDRTIVGLAVGKGESEAVLTDIIQTVYSETGDLKVREYFT